MAGFSDTLKNALLNHCFRNTAYTSPTTVYCALYTVAPTDAGGGTEVSGGSYARVAITFGAPSPAGTMANSSAVTFAEASADWNSGADIVAFGVFDAATSGTFMDWGPLTTPKPVLSGDTPRFDIGDLVLTLD